MKRLLASAAVVVMAPVSVLFLVAPASAKGPPPPPDVLVSLDCASGAYGAIQNFGLFDNKGQAVSAVINRQCGTPTATPPLGLPNPDYMATGPESVTGKPAGWGAFPGGVYTVYCDDGAGNQVTVFGTTIGRLAKGKDVQVCPSVPGVTLNIGAR